ncbi:hypothetical protein LY76DRAFT_604935 [Colletotrichum caudatum]|nr:hypothetical protein LY76DRAFT_604935 [Colletotrichum caudatum]
MPVLARSRCLCPNCQELNLFLDKPGEYVCRFRVSKKARYHLHQEIERNGIQCSHQTERNGWTETLVVTKLRELEKRRAVEAACESGFGTWRGHAHGGGGTITTRDRAGAETDRSNARRFATNQRAGVWRTAAAFAESWDYDSGNEVPRPQPTPAPPRVVKRKAESEIIHLT